MKKGILLTLVLAITGIMSLMAQTTALVTYEGGYFVKSGEEWTEYRPSDKIGKWSTYEQYKENDTFFYVKNKKCELAIPKLYKDQIFIRYEKDGEWKVVYNTLSVHLRCPESDGLFYTYRNHSMKHSEYDGYFVRDNLNWREYRPRMKSGVWAEFKQTAEDRKYFTLESSNNTVYIPKTTELDIVIKENGNPNWRGGYAIQAVYDRSAGYQYNFYYEKYAVGKGEFKNSARISLDNKCNIQIAFGGKHYDFVYTDIEILELNEKNDAVLITIDDNNFILLREGSATVDCEKIGKKEVFLVGATGKEYRMIAEQLEMGTFRF